MLLTPFLTATGFIAAIILVRGQLWSGYLYSQAEGEIIGNSLSVSLGLLWIYLAVSVAIIAFAWSIWSWIKEGRPDNYVVPNKAFGLLIALIIMAATDVGQSVLSISAKMLVGKNIGESLLSFLEYSTWSLPALIGVFIGALIIVGGSLYLSLDLAILPHKIKRLRYVLAIGLILFICLPFVIAFIGSSDC